MPAPRPQLLTLDDFGAQGRPLHARRFSALTSNTPGNVLVASCFLILILTEGRGEARHHEPLDIHHGDIHLVPPGMTFQLLFAGGMQGRVIAFDPTFLRSLRTSLWSDFTGRVGPRHAVPAQSLIARGLLRLRPDAPRWQRLNRLAAALEDELQETEWGAQNAAQALLVLILTELVRELQDHVPQAPLAVSGVVREALTFIERHCLQTLSLRDVAAAVHRTPSHLANAMREETGLTVSDWLREHRMVEARRRLLVSDASVEQVAGEVGYGDVTHFIRTFKGAHGVTPRVWRDQHCRRRAQGGA